MNLTEACAPEEVSRDQARRLSTDPQYNRRGLHASDDWFNRIPEWVYSERYVHTRVVS